MYSCVTSGTTFGIQGAAVQVEADISDGLPGLHLVGSLSKEVQESGERIRTALKNSGFHLPPKRIVISLSPADMRKNGSGFDLPIAVATLISMGRIPQAAAEDTLFLGELGLNGGILPVEGVLPVADMARRIGCRRIVVPRANRREAALVKGLTVIGAEHLERLIAVFQEPDWQERLEADAYLPEPETEEAVYSGPDFSELRGQPMLRRALEVAASGMHSLLMTGPPGVGKTLAAQCLAGILPELTFEESMELTKIYSVRGLLTDTAGLIRQRPFRAPHHTVTASALAGGGRIPRPGEISLAHNGVLFLDELPEFSRAAVEVLRQPLEEGVVAIGRLHGSYRFPARVMLAAARNPCPCGCYPDRNRCRCTPRQIQTYQGKISRAILDRLDISLSIRPVSFADMTRRDAEEDSAAIRRRVKQTQQIQRQRYQGTGIRFNSQLTQEGIRRYCRLGEQEEQFMKQIYEKKRLSGRGYHRILKLARTIADMEGAEELALRHLAEAAAYRLTGEPGEAGDGCE